MDAKPFANTPEFCAALGWFYAVWSNTELNIDYAIGKLENISPEKTHALVAKLKFSDKVKLLRVLLNKSAYTNIDKLQQYLNRIEKDSLRNAFSHSFLASDADSVMFIHRKSERGKYSPMMYHFPVDGFLAHVKYFARLSADFQKALGFSQKEIAAFASYALPETK